MLHNLVKVCAILLICLQLSVLQAQESINASGGDAMGSGGSVAFSIGQVVYTTNVGPAGSAAQGVQQVYKSQTVGVNAIASGISIKLFPNPTFGNLTLQISNYNQEKLSYQVYDIQGRILINEQIFARQTQVNMNALPGAAYFLHVVSHENQKIQSFKVIKLN